MLVLEGESPRLGFAQTGLHRPGQQRAVQPAGTGEDALQRGGFAEVVRPRAAAAAACLDGRALGTAGAALCRAATGTLGCAPAVVTAGLGTRLGRGEKLSTVDTDDQCQRNHYRQGTRNHHVHLENTPIKSFVLLECNDFLPRGYQPETITQNAKSHRRERSSAPGDAIELSFRG